MKEEKENRFVVVWSFVLLRRSAMMRCESGMFVCVTVCCVSLSLYFFFWSCLSLSLYKELTLSGGLFGYGLFSVLL